MNTVGCYKYIISDLNTHSDYIHATYDDAANAAKDYINTHGTLGMEYRVNIWYYEDSSPSDRYVQQDPFDYKKGTSSGTVTVTLPGDNNSPETTVTTSSTVDPTDSVPPPSQEGGTPSTPSNPSNPSKSSQTWTMSSTKSITYSNNGTFDLDTLITSGTPVGTKTWIITSGDSYASVSGNTLTIKGVGSVGVKLTASGSSSYYSKDASCTITIYPATAAQSWTLSNKAITFGDNALDMDNAVTGNTIGNKTWSVTNGTGSATIDKSSGVLTPTKGGTVIVKLVTAGGESGNYNYESREQTCTVTINRKNQDIGINGDSTVTVGGEIVLTVQNRGDRNITWESSDTTKAIVTKSSDTTATVKALAAGSNIGIKATASQSDTTNSSVLTKNITINNKQTQTLVIKNGSTIVTSTNIRLLKGSTLTLTCSGNITTPSWVADNTCAILSNEQSTDSTFPPNQIIVRGSSVGTCKVTVNCEANASYNAGTAYVNIVVYEKANQTVSIKKKSDNADASGSKITVGNELKLVSSGSTSVKSWSITEGTSYASITSTSNEATVTANARGRVKVKVIYNSNDNYNEGSKEIYLYVYANQNPSVTISNSNVVYTSDSDSTKTKELTITVKDSKTTASYKVKSGNIELSNNKITATGSTAGTAVVTVTCPEDTTNYWNKWTQDYTITIKHEKTTTTTEATTTTSTVIKIKQEFTLNDTTITYGNPDAKVTINGEYYGDITCDIANKSIATVSAISGNTIYINYTNVGTTTISVTASGNASYKSYTAEATLRIVKADGASFGVYGDDSVAIKGKIQLNHTDRSDRTITWSSEDNSIATVDNNGLVTGVKTGTVIIKAIANESSTMGRSEAGKSITITQAVQSFDLSNASIEFGSTINMNNSISGDAPIGSKTWLITPNTGNARIDSYSGVLTPISVGTVTVILSVNGDSNTAAKTVSSTVTITRKRISQQSELNSTTINCQTQLNMNSLLGTGRLIGTKTWSVINGTGSATINSSTGILTPSKAGIVTVTLVVSGGDEGNYSYDSIRLQSNITISRIDQPISVEYEPTVILNNTIKLTVKNGGDRNITCGITVGKDNGEFTRKDNFNYELKGTKKGTVQINFIAEESDTLSKSTCIININVKLEELKNVILNREYKFNSDENYGETAEADCKHIYDIFDIYSINSINNTYNVIFNYYNEDKVYNKFYVELKKVKQVVYIYKNNNLFGFITKKLPRTRTISGYNYTFEPYIAENTYNYEEYGDISTNLMFINYNISLKCSIDVYDYIDTGYLERDNSPKFNNISINLTNRSNRLSGYNNIYELKIDDIISKLSINIQKQVSKYNYINYYVRLNSRSKNLNYYNCYKNNKCDIPNDNYILNNSDPNIICPAVNLYRYDYMSNTIKDYYESDKNSILIYIPSNLKTNKEFDLSFDLCIVNPANANTNINNFNFNIKYINSKNIIKTINIDNYKATEIVEYTYNNNYYKAAKFKIHKSYLDSIDNYSSIYKLLDLQYKQHSKNTINNISTFENYISELNNNYYNNILTEERKPVITITCKDFNNNKQINTGSTIYVENNTIRRFEIRANSAISKCRWYVEFIGDTPSWYTDHTTFPPDSTDRKYNIYIEDLDYNFTLYNDVIILCIRGAEESYRFNLKCIAEDSDKYKSNSNTYRFNITHDKTIDIIGNKTTAAPVSPSPETTVTTSLATSSPSSST